MAEHSIEKNKLEYQQVELQIKKEVVQAYYNYEATKKQVKQYRGDLLDNAQKLLDGVVYKYKRGEISIVDVLIAQRTYNDVQEKYFEIMEAHANALIGLEKACGTWDINF